MTEPMPIPLTTAEPPQQIPATELGITLKANPDETLSPVERVRQKLAMDNVYNSDLDLNDVGELLLAYDKLLTQINAAGPRRKGIYIGAPACFALDLACKHLNEAFGDGSFGCYVVGSAMQRPDWRDVDVRMILDDSAFARLFPNAGDHWEFDQRWLILTTAISQWLSKQTGLPVDFQFQSQTHANKRHKGPRSAVGIAISRETKR